MTTVHSSTRSSCYATAPKGNQCQGIDPPFRLASGAGAAGSGQVLQPAVSSRESAVGRSGRGLSSQPRSSLGRPQPRVGRRPGCTGLVLPFAQPNPKAFAAVVNGVIGGVLETLAQNALCPIWWGPVVQGKGGHTARRSCTACATRAIMHPTAMKANATPSRGRCTSVSWMPLSMIPKPTSGRGPAADWLGAADSCAPACAESGALWS